MDVNLNNVKHLASAFRSADADSSAEVSVAIYLDETASAFLVGAVRRAFSPQTTAATVQVRRLDDETARIEDGADAVVVLSCGSEQLEHRVLRLLSAGTPVVVVAESTVEAPFIERDTRLLGLVTATDEPHLLTELGRWILDRTEKDAAFAANFEFMRVSAAGRAIASCALANAATALIVFPRGADFPTMTLAQLDMMLKLAGIYGRPIGPERACEAVGVVGAAYGMRAAARTLSRSAGRAGILVKAAIGGAGSCAVGLGLCALYRSDLDCSWANEVVDGTAARVRERVGARSGATGSQLAPRDVPATARAGVS